MSSRQQHRRLIHLDLTSAYEAVRECVTLSAKIVERARGKPVDWSDAGRAVDTMKLLDRLGGALGRAERVMKRVAAPLRDAQDGLEMPSVLLVVMCGRIVNSAHEAGIASARRIRNAALNSIDPKDFFGSPLQAVEFWESRREAVARWNVEYPAMLTQMANEVVETSLAYPPDGDPLDRFEEWTPAPLRYISSFNQIYWEELLKETLTEEGKDPASYPMPRSRWLDLYWTDDHWCHWGWNNVPDDDRRRLHDEAAKALMEPLSPSPLSSPRFCLCEDARLALHCWYAVMDNYSSSLVERSDAFCSLQSAIIALRPPNGALKRLETENNTDLFWEAEKELLTLRSRILHGEEIGTPLVPVTPAVDPGSAPDDHPPEPQSTNVSTEMKSDDPPITLPNVYLLTGISDSRTLGRYIELAGLRATERGERHRKFTKDEVRAILEAIINNSGEQALIVKCRASLQTIN